MEQGVELEARILTLLRRKSNYYKYRKLLQPQFFQQEVTRSIFTLIDEHFSSGKAEETKLTRVNLKVLAHQKIRNRDLKLEVLKLIRETRQFSTRDNAIIENATKDFVQRNLVKIAILKGLEALDKPITDFAEVNDHISQAMAISTEKDADYYQYFHDTLDRIDDDKLTRISTGIPTLDKILGGGLTQGSLTVFLAPPERGKTLALVNIATAALYRGLTVGYLTLELSERWVARRFDLRISGRSITLLRNDPTRIKNPLAALRKNGCSLVIKDYSADNPRIEDLRSFIINYQNRHKQNFDLLCVDYADLISPSRNYKQERFGIKEVYTNLRRLGLEFNFPIVTASQANRKSSNKLIVTMEDFAEDYAKAAISDVVIAICQTPEELESDMSRLYVCKNRLTGKHKVFRVEYKSKTMFMGEQRNEN